MKNYLLPIFVLLIVGCGNRNPANIVVENRIRQTEQTDSIIGDSYERDTIQGDFNGDGKIEYAYSESNPAEYYSLDEVEALLRELLAALFSIRYIHFVRECGKK